MFTSDQTRQFYVVTKALTSGSIAQGDPAGTLLLKANTVEHSPYEPFLMFSYKSPNGNGGDEIVRTDLIPLANIEYVSAKTHQQLRRNYTRLVVSFNSNVAGGAPVVGLKYALAINFKGSQILRERGFTKFTEGYVAKTGDTAATIMNAMKASLDLLINSQKLPIKTTVSGNTLVIEEVARTFYLGKTNVRPIDFEVYSPEIEGEWNTAWASVANTTSTNTAYQINGPEIANMEWFYLGERMPHGRFGLSDNRFFQASYLANPGTEYGTVDISYFYKGNNEDTQHSRKVISLAVVSSSNVTPADIAAAIDALRFPAPSTPTP